MSETPNHMELLERWSDRDLLAAARAGELAPAFEVDESLRQVSELIAADRNPILLGDPGVGKTAVIHEWLRRQVSGASEDVLGGRRVLQVSLQTIVRRLRKPAEEIGEVFADLTRSIVALADEVLVFIPDAHLLEPYDLEHATDAFLSSVRRSVLWEGLQGRFQRVYDHAPQLEQHFVALPILEPQLEQALAILKAWTADRHGGARFSEEALETALDLTHRFHVRSRLPRKALDLLRQVDAIVPAQQAVSSTDVLERFGRLHHTPRVIIDPDMPLDLGEVEREFNERVIGQQDAVGAVARTIGMIKAGLSDPRRPLGAFLFVGPTGVGKTHLAQCLARYLFGSSERVVRFNMGDYNQEWSAQELFGNPHMPALAARRGQLTQRLLGQPLCVLLLDELEKAHPLIHDRWLQLFDEGTFTNGANERVSCRATIIVATSNAGAEVFRGAGFGFGDIASRERRQTELQRRLEDHFRIEFLNRFDQVVQFHPLTRDEIRAVAVRELEQMLDRVGLRRRRLVVSFDPSVADWLAVNGYDPEFGARLLRRTMERSVTTELAGLIVRHNPAPGARIELFVRGNEIRARLETEAPDPRTAVTITRDAAPVSRNLSREALADEIAAVLERGRPLLEQLEEARQQRSAELKRMQAPGFWDRRGERQETLDLFRRLDVSIRARERLARPLLRLADLRDRQAEPTEQARQVEAATAAVREWQAQRAEDGPARIWVALAITDTLRPASGWLRDLAQMETRWAGRLRLACRPVAVALEDDLLTRVVLEVEGPGAARYLAMEAGVHRRLVPDAADERVHVRLFEEARPADELPAPRPVHDGNVELDLPLRWKLRVPLPRKMDLFGDDREGLLTVAHSLQQAPDEGDHEREIVRIYGGDAGARDPRTGAQVPRLKDALRGKLERLLEAWLAQAPNP